MAFPMPTSFPEILAVTKESEFLRAGINFSGFSADDQPFDLKITYLLYLLHWIT